MSRFHSPYPEIVADFLDVLRESAYQGGVFTDEATRLVNATDNSIYQVIPQAVLAPKTAEDLGVILKTGAQDRFKDVRFMPRGGGTGTNGQALNDCIIIDTSRHLTKILDINAHDRRVRVQPGVVLDQLNRALEKHGLFFPPHVSPSKSATIGGMVSTDACGKGSRVYGKTGDYVLSLACVLADGREIRTDSYDNDALAALLQGSYADICAEAPDLPRGISGYDLVGAFRDGKLDMNRLIAGSEGSLAVLQEITLRVVKKPACRALVSVAYGDFDTALRQVAALLKHDPASIETVDDRILDLARGDILWRDVRVILPEDVDAATVRGLHFVEFEAQDDAALKEKTETFRAHLAADDAALGYHVSYDAREIHSIGALRSKCVGLLGNMDGARRPVPFIEDAAVPPENLAPFIRDFKALLAGHGLESGAFGHADAGCLHVRPALDLRNPDDEALVRTLSDAVAALAKKYGGVLWGEHGKGMRSAYTQELIGPRYFALMQKVKALLDPDNKLNPGKIAAADGRPLKMIDGVPLRAHADRQIDARTLATFPKAVQCNGNGLCFSAMPDDTMCPSYKATGERRHSPKGRAALLREWMRLESTDKKAAHRFAPDVYDALSGCLSCKACTSVCPIHVNIPDMKSAFLARYYKRRARPLADYVIANAETASALLSFIPFHKDTMGGLVDLPAAARPSLRTLMKAEGFSYATPARIKKTARPVVVVQDAYTSFYEPQVVMSVLWLIRKLGFEPLVTPFRQSGKSFHVRGFLRGFRAIVRRNVPYYERLGATLAPMVGIDPSLTLVYRDEYAQVLGHAPRFKIRLLHEWLLEIVRGLPSPKIKTIPQSSYPLFLHCTEKTAAPESADAWIEILKAFDVNAAPAQTGCCGMAGAYGHEAQHQDTSETLYDLSWKAGMTATALVTGYSCRAQVKRMEGYGVLHPAELIDTLL